MPANRSGIPSRPVDDIATGRRAPRQGAVPPHVTLLVANGVIRETRGSRGGHNVLITRSDKFSFLFLFSPFSLFFVFSPSPTPSPRALEGGLDVARSNEWTTPRGGAPSVLRLGEAARVSEFRRTPLQRHRIDRTCPS